MKIQRVLCPTDFSDCAFKAVRHASAIARWHGADLHVLHVAVDVVAPAQATGGPMPLVIVRETSAEIERRLHDWLGEAGVPDAGTTVVARDGEPARAIVRYTREAAIDVVVLGTEGLNRVERAALGSVAERVLHHAPCPVLTIPPGAEKASEHPAVAFERILCAVDFSEQSQAAVAMALSIARENQGNLTLLHVLETLTEEEARLVAHYRVGEFVEMRRRELAAELKTLIPDSARPWCKAVVLVELGRPAQIILRVAKEAGADLIVMGSQGHSGLTAAIFGSATHTVVHRATVPVLTVGRRDRKTAAA